MDAVDAIGWALLGLAAALLIWMVRQAFVRDQRLDARLAQGDMSLFDEQGVDIEEVVRAPVGSVLQSGRLMELDQQPPLT